MRRRAFFSFFARRFLLFILVVFTAVTVNFIIPRFAPGNPVRAGIMARYGIQADQSMVNKLVEYYENYFGLNQPLYIQYARFIKSTFTGDLGYSIVNYPRLVTDMISEKIIWTLSLVIPATILAALFGSLLGALFAFPRIPKSINLVVPGLILFSAIPAFLAAIALIYVFAAKLNWLPLVGAYDPTFVPHVIPISPTASIPNYGHWPTLQQIVKHSILPVAALVLTALGGWALNMRGMMVTIQGEDYMTFAEAKGLSDRRLFGYTVRNALLPQITGLGVALSSVLVAGILVEVIFGYPGIGGLITGAIQTRDFPVIYANSLIVITLLAGATFVLDMIYPLLDPRITYERK
jgi:peptide/nickel transport system permease protein